MTPTYRTLAFSLLIAALSPINHAADGDYDSRFGIQGRRVSLPAAGSMEAAGGFTGAAYTPEGDIIAVVSARPMGQDSDMAVMKFSANGTLLTTFDGDGTRLIALDRGGSNDDNADWVEVLPDGRILVAGSSMGTADGESDFAFVQLLPNGAFDPDFGNAGRSFVGFNLGGSGQRGDWLFRALRLQSGKIVGLGQAETDTGSAGAVVRLNADGLRDSSFDGDGMWTYGGDDETLIFTRALGLPDGGMLVCGSRIPSGGTDSEGVVLRLDAQGSPLPSFGTQGLLRVDHDLGGAHADLLMDCVLHSNGSLYTATASEVSAPSNTDIVIDRWTLMGQPYVGYSGGVITGDAGGSMFDAAYVMREDSRRRLVLAGRSEGDGNDSDVLVARLLPNGTPDPQFGIGGRMFRSFHLDDDTEQYYEIGLALLPDAQDRIHIVGMARHAAGMNYVLSQMRLIGDSVFADGID